jgi:hypothetical protein
MEFGLYLRGNTLHSRYKDQPERAVYAAYDQRGDFSNAAFASWELRF